MLIELGFAQYDSRFGMYFTQYFNSYVGNLQSLP